MSGVLLVNYDTVQECGNGEYFYTYTLKQYFDFITSLYVFGVPVGTVRVYIDGVCSISMGEKDCAEFNHILGNQLPIFLDSGVSAQPIPRNWLANHEVKIVVLRKETVIAASNTGLLVSGRFVPNAVGLPQEVAPMTHSFNGTTVSFP